MFRLEQFRSVGSGGLLKILHLVGVVLVAVSVLPAAFTNVSAAEDFAGIASIVDGDTIIVGTRTVRLHGIDAPEVGQKCRGIDGRNRQCGKIAMGRMAELIEGRIVSCRDLGEDGFDRTLATCSCDGTDINARMVEEGMAWAFVRYSSEYVAQEARAREARTGIWSGEAVPAWTYRKQRWTVAVQEAPEGCPIKGNISSNGKIYHPPWSPWYSRTKVSVEKGERWFCSEREALDAGWRAPRWR